MTVTPACTQTVLRRVVGLLTWHEPRYLSAVLLSHLQDPARRQSQTSNSGAANPEQSKADLPQPTRPLLCKNITSLKWEGPVLDASKSAVASVLAELVMLPEFCAAVNDRLVVPRLTSLLLGVLKSTEDASGG